MDKNFKNAMRNDHAFQGKSMKARVLAVLRSLEHKVADYPHLMLTSCTGEVGAASGPLMLAYLASVMSRTDGPGKKGLLHLSADNGQRAAAIVRERAWCAVGTKMQNGTFCM
ncbi:hypothetical protein EAZG_00426 [Escherichia coli TA249]|nr:hypothetical protein HMPREF0986_00335 [Escherichia coli 4_1_47FAA]OSL85857.1 hypothetical protein EAZG_00426 [Escherichia coli TA249]